MLLKNLKKVANSKELYSHFLKGFLMVNGIKLQPKIEAILSYFMEHGFSQSTYDRILEDKIVPTAQSINNAKSILVDKGLMVKTPRWGLSGGLENVSLDDQFHIVVRCKIEKQEES